MNKIEIMRHKPEYVELMNTLADEIMGHVLPEPRAQGERPCAVRLEQLDVNVDVDNKQKPGSVT